MMNDPRRHTQKEMGICKDHKRFFPKIDLDQKKKRKTGKRHMQDRQTPYYESDRYEDH